MGGNAEEGIQVWEFAVFDLLEGGFGNADLPGELRLGLSPNQAERFQVLRQIAVLFHRFPLLYTIKDTGKWRKKGTDLPEIRADIPELAQKEDPSGR